MMLGRIGWSIGHERAAACSAVKATRFAGSPHFVRVGLDGLRSLPQLAGRDRRAIVQAAPAPSQPPAPHGSAVPSWGHRSYPVTEFNQSRPQPCRFTARPWPRAPRSRLAGGKARGAKRPHHLYLVERSLSGIAMEALTAAQKAAIAQPGSCAGAAPMCATSDRPLSRATVAACASLMPPRRALSGV